MNRLEMAQAWIESHPHWKGQRVVEVRFPASVMTVEFVLDDGTMLAATGLPAVQLRHAKEI